MKLDCEGEMILIEILIHPIPWEDRNVHTRNACQSQYLKRERFDQPAWLSPYFKAIFFGITI